MLPYCTGTATAPNSIESEANAPAFCPALILPLPIIEPVTLTSPASTITSPGVEPFPTFNAGTNTVSFASAPIFLPPNTTDPVIPVFIWFNCPPITPENSVLPATVF